MFKKICLLMLAVLNLSLSSIFGHESSTATDLEKIISSVSENVIENKVYLKPGLVHIAPDAILLQIDTAFVPIERLYADEDGVYVDITVLSKLIFCDKCKRYYDPEKQYPSCYHEYKKKKLQ